MRITVPDDRPRSLKWVLGVVIIGTAYLSVVGWLYVRDAGFVAAYLTIPAWFFIGIVSLLASALVPNATLEATLFTWTGNLVAVMLSATINVLMVYVVARRFVKP